MSQSPATTLQHPNPMKKKALAALMAVAVGHVAVLFAVSQMQSPELKKIDKEPIKVRFVKIKEVAPPPPPPPAEPIKPKVQPKPEPKVVEPPPVVKPKVIAKKPEPKVEKTKPIVVDESLNKQKLEHERLEQQRKNQERLDQQKRDQALRDQEAKAQAERDRLAREQAERDRLARERAAAQSTPRNISQGEIEWSRSPKLSFTNKELDNASRSLQVSILADPSGKIKTVELVKSSGLAALDAKVLRAVRSSKFKATKDGRAVRANLPLVLNPDS